jgi:DNA polymerase
VKPNVLFCLGATAARAAIDPELRIHRHRGRRKTARIWSGGAWIEVAAVASIHPAHILRTPDPARRQELVSWLETDLSLVADRAADAPSTRTDSGVARD